MTDTIKPIDETEKLTAWKLAQSLETIAKFLKEIPLSPIVNIEETERFAYERVETSIININNRIGLLQKVIQENEQKMFDALDKYYVDTRDAIQKTNKRLAELPDIKEAPHIPYNLKELLEAATMLSHLSESEWNRVEKMAHIFAESKKEEMENK